MFCKVALDPVTNTQRGAFLLAERDAHSSDRWNRSMAAQKALLLSFKTEQDYIEWLQDRKQA